MDDQHDDVDWYSDEAATFGDRLAGAREAMGLTQAQLARKLGVKLATLQGWEQDLTEPRANKLQMVSGMLGVSITWLINGKGDGLDGPDDVLALPGDLRDLLAELRQIRGQMMASAERVGVIEKTLRGRLKDM